MVRQKAQLAQLLSEAVSGLRADLREEKCGGIVYAARGSDSIAHAGNLREAASEIADALMERMH